MENGWRGWAYWPSRAEYAIPWLVGPSLFIALGALGFSSRYVEAFSADPRGDLASLLLIVVGSIFNGTLLFMHIRSAFVFWRNALLPTFGTLVLLSLSYGLLWGGLLTLDGAILCVVCRRGLEVDQPLTLHVTATAVQVLASVLLVSAFWKTDDPNVARLQRLRARALKLLPRVTDGSASQQDYDDLIAALDQLPRAAGEIGLLVPKEQALVRSWSEAALRLHGHLSGFMPADLPEHPRFADISSLSAKLAGKNAL